MRTDTLHNEWRGIAEELDVPSSTQRIINAAMTQMEGYHLPTAEHCKRVGILAVRIGQYIDLPLKPLFYGASLHDRGKLNVTKELLNKTEEWTEEDAIALQDHPADGYDVTIDEGMVVTAGLIVRHHTFQPNSYPLDLPPAPPFMVDTFTRCARVIAIADFYDAAHRADSDAVASDEAIRAKMMEHNTDVQILITNLYEEGIFT